jgi:hypothetical protein
MANEEAQDVEVEYNGRIVRGRYSVSQNVITVTTLGGSKSTQLGRMTGPILAKILLSELAEEGKGGA